MARDWLWDFFSSSNKHTCLSSSDVYKLKSTSTNLCCCSCVKRSRGLKFSTLWLLHYFSTFMELDVRDLTLFFSSWTFGNRRVNNNWQNWNSYSCNEFHGRLHNCRFKSLHLVLFWFLQNSSSTYRVGWSKYLFLANEWKKKTFCQWKFRESVTPFCCVSN